MSHVHQAEAQGEDSCPLNDNRVLKVEAKLVSSKWLTLTPTIPLMATPYKSQPQPFYLRPGRSFLRLTPDLPSFARHSRAFLRLTEVVQLQVKIVPLMEETFRTYWPNLPQEIRDKVLEYVVCGTTFRNIPCGHRYSAPPHARVRAPHIGAISTVSKSFATYQDIVTLILRSSKVKLNDSAAISHVARRLTSKQRHIPKRFSIDNDFTSCSDIGPLASTSDSEISI